MREHYTPAPRTVLEHLIRERRQTFEEFAEFAERFAREHGESGTLSVRHLQRLVAGRQRDGLPLGKPRPATARLLERIFGLSIGDLLASPSSHGMPLVGEAHALRVAVAVVVRDEQVLVVCRRDDPGGVIAWQFPAGIVKPGNTSDTVAVRETLAETGVHCVVSRRLGSRLHPITRVYCDYILCDYVAGSAMNADAVENVGVAWADRSQLARLIPADQIYPPVLDALTAKLSANV